jgi:hypothetical protein
MSIEDIAAVARSIFTLAYPPTTAGLTAIAKNLALTERITLAISLQTLDAS